MNLSSNNIRNIKNDAFRNLFVLNYLNLSRNVIENLNPASFMITDTPQLTKLDLSYNMLTEISSEPFSHLPSLRFLFLENNRITTLADDCFTSLKSLSGLNLRNNKLTALNMTLMSLKSLQTLDISFNYLLKLSSFEINRCGALISVNMSYNAIESVESNCFTQAFSLQSLDLSNNKIRSPIENIMFVNNNQLATLNFYNNCIEHIDDDAFKHNYLLTNLNMERIFLKGDISDKMLSGLQNVTRLDFFNQSITAIRDDAFSTLISLVYLNLSRNVITKIGKKAFPNSTSLKVLDISYNNVPNLDFLNGLYSLSKLMTLSVSSNMLTNVNLSFFPDLINVDVSNNNISYINNSFFQNLDHLQSIDLSFNRISKLPPGAFQSLKILKVLNVSSNFIKNLRYGSFKGLNRTEVIDLSRNDIHVLDVDVFHECTELKRLIIDYNFITQLDFDRLILTVSKLNALSLGGNPIMCKEIVRNYNKGFVRRVEVTSIDKVFEDDNVHGISCGDIMATTLASETASPTEPTGGHSVSSLLIIWCMVLTICIIALGVCSYFYKSKRVVFRRGSTSMRSTLEFSGSAFNSDLLT
ncbi:LOW QUALITY PROTEIN: uncharacterized protein [Choristoneura fumiferana]|uniref:LOW QUALITY PROTEIN: uncharacterized protein n=1 Tax=Choristoneura fumiferana TaxID=7141 RepID=UPI003D15AC33